MGYGLLRPDPKGVQSPHRLTNPCWRFLHGATFPKFTCMETFPLYNLLGPAMQRSNTLRHNHYSLCCCHRHLLLLGQNLLSFGTILPFEFLFSRFFHTLEVIIQYSSSRSQYLYGILTPQIRHRKNKTPANFQQKSKARLP